MRPKENSFKSRELPTFYKRTIIVNNPTINLEIPNGNQINKILYNSYESNTLLDISSKVESIIYKKMRNLVLAGALFTGVFLPTNNINALVRAGTNPANYLQAVNSKISCASDGINGNICGNNEYVYKVGSTIYNLISMDTPLGGISMSELMIKNMDRLNTIAAFKENWNGYGGEAFSKQLIDNISIILMNIIHQPEIFPTGRQSIQLEYEEDSGKYLELEVFLDKVCVYSVDDNDNDDEYEIKNDINSINKVVSRFYGTEN